MTGAPFSGMKYTLVVPVSHEMIDVVQSLLFSVRLSADVHCDVSEQLVKYLYRTYKHIKKIYYRLGLHEDR